MSEKTNIGLVKHALKALAEGWVYWYGTYGKKCTKDVYNSKRNQYPEHYTDDRTAKYNQHIAEGRTCADCIGLMKSYMWLDEETGKLGYGKNGFGDKSANDMYASAKVKGDIKTIPEVVGLGLHKDGHVGVYIGDGWVIEERGFAYGCVKTRLKDRNWLHWFELPGCKYIKDGVITPEAEPAPVEATKPLIKKGSKGNYVIELQNSLMKLGYSLPKFGADGDFGGETLDAVKKFQADKGLVVDGEVGNNTWKAIDEAISKLSTEKPVVAPANPVAVEKKYIVINSGSWNIRTGPSTGFSVIGIAKAGDKFEATGRDSGNFWEIIIGTKTGWVSKNSTK